MAREVVIYTWCDVCFGRHQERNEGEEFTLALSELGMNKPLTLSMCEAHRKEFYDDLRDLLQEFGQKTEPRAAKKTPTTGATSGTAKTGRPSREELTCPECGHQAPNKSALASHARHMHSTSVAELTGEPTPYVCPECQRQFSRPQGLGAHRRSVHGVAGTSSHPNGKRAQAADETLV